MKGNAGREKFTRHRLTLQILTVLTAQEAKVKQQLSMPVNETGSLGRRTGCLDRNRVRPKESDPGVVKRSKESGACSGQNTADNHRLDY
jgi:hypothetical protein